MTEDYPQVPYTKSGDASDFPYEIYEPDSTTDAYMVLEADLTELFDEESASDYTPIDKAIWLWEAGISYYHPAPYSGNKYVASYDTLLTATRSVSLELYTNNGSYEILNSDLTGQISQTHNQLINMAGNEEYHGLTDVRFLEISGNQLLLEVSSIYYINPVYETSGTTSPPTLAPTPPSATSDFKAIGINRD